MPSPTATLPAPELEDYAQFAARIGASKRTIIRLVENGLPIIEIGRLRRIDPVVAMAWIRGEVRAEPVRRGRPKKDAASATAATGTPRRPKLRLRHRARGSL